MRLEHNGKILSLHEQCDYDSYSPPFESSEDYEKTNINHRLKEVSTKNLLLAQKRYRKPYLSLTLKKRIKRKESTVTEVMAAYILNFSDFEKKVILIYTKQGFSYRLFEFSQSGQASHSKGFPY